MERDVRFVEAGDDVNEAIDAAYRTKYQRYAARYVNPHGEPGSARRDDQARAALLEPREPGLKHPAGTGLARGAAWVSQICPGCRLSQ